jgi:hypothetical protein
MVRRSYESTQPQTAKPATSPLYKILFQEIKIKRTEVHTVYDLNVVGYFIDGAIRRSIDNTFLHEK